MSARLACVHVFVRDLERAAHFYTRALGLRVSHRQAGACYLTSGAAHHEIALFEHGSEQAPPPPLAVGCRSLGFEVTSKAELAQLCDRLGGARATAVDNGITWSIHTTDPDGNRIEVFCDTRHDAERSGSARGTARALSLTELRAAREEVFA